MRLASALVLAFALGCSSESGSSSSAAATSTSHFHASKACALVDLNYFVSVFGVDPAGETPQRQPALANHANSYACDLDLAGDTGNFSTLAMLVCPSACEEEFNKDKSAPGAKTLEGGRVYLDSQFHQVSELGSSGAWVQVSIPFVPDSVKPRIDLDEAAQRFADTAIQRLAHD
jgi:hypothetical protein